MIDNCIIEETSLSSAWVSTLRHIFENKGTEITPFILSLRNFDESIEVRSLLDRLLKDYNYSEISTVSETIFPQSLYEYCNKEKDVFFEEYKNNLHRIKAIDKSNRSGTYFERLISYGMDKQKEVNQLDIIIDSLNDIKSKRRSKLQASIFNPFIDHKPGPYQSFPCLQHVTFYKTSSNELILNSFYAIQYLFRRSYGNWLGLINLGKFIAEQTNLKFEKLNCFVGVQKLDEISKTQAQEILFDINNLNT